MLEAYRVVVSGIVQGVGFRPFVYRVAKKAGVKGYVRNMGGSEVEIHIEGDSRSIKRFMELFDSELPPVAMIYRREINKVRVNGFVDFEILPSQKKSIVRSIVPPDFASCIDCINEVDDPHKRWYRYPFNSCAYCGPRYSIMMDIPYDREKTSMNDFPLCRECSAEYRDPGNIRRFHAQGISCPLCGPKVWLADRDGREIHVDDPVREAAKLINEGYIISIKGIGGFHIACLASDDDVVLELRKRKKRPQKPFAIMAKDVETASRLVILNKDAEQRLLSPQHPIILLEKRENTPASEYVAPGLKHLGIFLPYTPLHHILMNHIEDGFAIMTSGNPRGEPMCIKNSEAIKKLGEIVDYHLLHNRRIVNRVDDSVIRYTYKWVTMLRRGRGYAPTWIILPRELNRDVVAFGAMLQNTGGVGFEDKAVLTQFIGDCDEYRTLLDLKIYIRRISRLYRIDPRKAVVAVDLHPGYPTRMLAEEWSRQYNVDIIEIQHHWAHITSVMAEKGIRDPIVGIAIDGAGYGPDGHIWGGEVIKASSNRYERLGHLEYIEMPGGDLATVYPVRILIAILSRFMSEEELIKFISNRNYLVKAGRDPRELDIILRQVENKQVYTSSMGRALDAASTLLDICHIRTYEGEPAMKLEASSEESRAILEPHIVRRNGAWIVETHKLFERIIELMDSVDHIHLAYEIQRALAVGLAEIALKYCDDRVAISGGAAVNSIIVKSIVDRCREEDIEVLINTQVPPGDGGISLGQIYIAGYMDYI